MKYLLLLCCAFFAVNLSAQTKTQIVTNVETDNSFTFGVKLDDQRKADLVDAYLEVVNIGSKKPMKMEFEGESETTTPNGTIIMLNTKRHSLKIKSAKGNDVSLEEAREWANIGRESLGLDVPETPATPTRN
jgi:hypothetical protein